jgi:hypothetical protein
MSDDREQPMNRDDILSTETQPVDILPPAPQQWHKPQWSQWKNHTPILVETMVAHAGEGVTESEVVEHLRELFTEVTSDVRVTPLEVHGVALRRYLDEYVAVAE